MPNMFQKAWFLTFSLSHLLTFQFPIAVQATLNAIHTTNKRNIKSHHPTSTLKVYHAVRNMPKPYSCL